VPLKSGTIINDKYRIVRLVDERGVGAVYEGRRLRGDAPVAIKVLRRKFSADSEWIARFERETAVAARMSSARLARFLDVGVLPDRRRFMVMEYLEGEKLSTRMERELRIAPAVMVDLTLQLLEALHQVHEAGIVHRGISPTSVFLQKMGRLDYVCLLDFGVCKDMTDKLRDITTGQGQLLSAVAYSAPEALTRGSGQADARSDLFSVGVLLYRGISGVAPFPAQDPQELLERLRAGEPMPLSQAAESGVDTMLSDIAQRALERLPDDRFQNADAMSEALCAWQKSRETAHAPLASDPAMDASGKRGQTLRLNMGEVQQRMAEITAALPAATAASVPPAPPAPAPPAPAHVPARPSVAPPLPPVLHVPRAGTAEVVELDDVELDDAPTITKQVNVPELAEMARASLPAEARFSPMARDVTLLDPEETAAYAIPDHPPVSAEADDAGDFADDDLDEKTLTTEAPPEAQLSTRTIRMSIDSVLPGAELPAQEPPTLLHKPAPEAPTLINKRRPPSTPK
jgi:serine/threonine-protein kinase